MKLHFQKYGEGAPLVILHGLFGSADNWATLGKKLANFYTVYLIDQRNHGRSPHAEEFTYDVLAADIYGWLNEQNLSKVSFVGHSMGGKTAMRFAQLYPDMLHRLVVVDIGVKQYPMHHGPVLEGLKAVDLAKLNSRTEADEAMQAHIPDFATRQFLLKSLYRVDKEQFGWRLNIVALEKAMPDILAALPDTEVDIPALFVGGTKSDYIKPEDKNEISQIFTHAQFKELPAGHWIHAEDPDGLENILRNFVTG